MKCPSHIDQAHLQEWLDSGVDPEIIAANVISLHGEELWDYLLYSDKLDRRNDGRLTDRLLKTYSHLDDGGWWCSGRDPLDDWQPMMWGCAKTNSPRTKPQGFGPQKEEKLIKYEHPLKTETRAFFLDVPDYIWQQVAERYGIPISEEDRQHSFWWWVWKHNVPVIITEGAKKAGCLLTQGYAAIALPGIWNGRRKATETQPERLIPDLQHFATLGREVGFCFDYEVRWKTKLNVENAITQTGRLFEQSGCKVKVIQLPGPEKGIDDFIVAQGPEAFEEVYGEALTFELWQAKRFARLTYSASQVVDRHYLGELNLPNDAKLIAIKSPKGTGKTESLISLVDQALAESRPVLLIGHRVQLVQAICNRLGIPYVTELRSSEEGRTLGYGVCADSLHANSQAQFNAEGWDNALVLIDESEQVFWHGLASNTAVKQHRIEIISNLKQLFSNVLNSDHGQIVLADADLSDRSIDFVKGLVGTAVEPWILVNKWRPKHGWDIHSYDSPKDWYASLNDHVEDGPIFVSVDGQKGKSKWGTKSLEKDLKQRFPGKRILRIDSEAVSNPNHSAYGCITKLNQVLRQYDIVICSPSIETGVSIDIRGHFQAVFDFSQGVCPADTVRQRLARVREPIERHIYVAKKGLNTSRIGNGSVSVKSLLASQHKVANANIISLVQAGMEFDVEGGVNANQTALITWAKMAAGINAGFYCYRDSVLQGLREEGHNIVEVEKADPLGAGLLDENYEDSLTASRDENYFEEREAISTAEDITTSEYEQLSQKKAKTSEERDKERKYELKQRYQVPVTSELIEKDDDGWYPQIQLHYYLTVGREFLRDRDKRAAESIFHEGKTWLPDLNRSQLGTKVGFLDRLGLTELLLELLDSGQQWSGESEKVQQIAELAVHNRWQIKAVLNVTVSKEMEPVQVIQVLLDKLGLKLECIGRRGSRDERARIYQFIDPGDSREQVFAAWLEREREGQSMAA